MGVLSKGDRTREALANELNAESCEDIVSKRTFASLTSFHLDPQSNLRQISVKSDLKVAFTSCGPT